MSKPLTVTSTAMEPWFQYLKATQDLRRAELRKLHTPLRSLPEALADIAQSRAPKGWQVAE